MLVQAKRLAKGSARSVLVSLGLFSRAKRGVEWLRALPYWHKTRFTLQIAGADVSFVTRDAHSKVWCHRRHENRQGDLHEPAIIKEFARCVKDATVFADIGGHIGYYSCIAGMLHPRLQIFCFEMNHHLVQVIETNFQANALHNAIVVPSPVAEKRKLVSYSGVTISGGHSINTKNQAGQRHADLVYTETVTLDEFFTTQGVAPDIIKIDVEGAEMDVLRGATSILDTHRPLLFLEIHPDNLVDFGSSVEEIVKHLQGYHYRFFKTEYFRLDGKVEEIEAGALLLLGRSDMVICVPEGQIRHWEERRQISPGQLSRRMSDASASELV